MRPTRTLLEGVLSRNLAALAICALFVLSSYLLYAQDAPQPASQPLLANGGFEDGNGGPRGWQKGQQVPGVDYLWTSGLFYEGKACVCLKKTAQRYFPVAEWHQSFPHSGDSSQLRVSAWVKAQKASKAILDVQFTSTAGEWSHQWAAYIGAKNPDDPPADHDWKLYSGIVSVPEGTLEIKVALQIYGPGTVAFDNVSAEYVGAATVAAHPSPAPDKEPAPPSLLPLKNAGFEEGERLPLGWKQGAPVPGVYYLWDRQVAYEGKASLCLKKNVKKYFPIAQWLQSVPHTSKASKLKASAWVKADRAYKGILDVQFISEHGKWSHEWAAYIGAKKDYDPPANHEWKLYSGTVSIPYGTKEIRIAPQIYGPGTLWFDNIAAEYIE